MSSATALAVQETPPLNPAYPNLKPRKPGTFGRPKGRKSAYSQAVLQQDLLMRDIMDPKTKPSIRAGLSRAWDVLEERKRILRGKPLPGQLRPDLDPVQMARAMKRSRDRLLHGTKQIQVIGPVEANQESTPGKALGNDDSKESTSGKGGGDGVTGEGGATGLEV